MEIKEKISDKIEILKTTTAQVPDKMMKDAFIGLSVAMFQEFFMSSDLKYLLFSAMLSNLEKMGYTPEEMNTFKSSLNESIQKFNQRNDFMG